MPVVFSALMCHAPIVHPEVAGPRAEDCRRTTRAMREVAARVVASRPDRVVLVSPHSPRHPVRLAAWQGQHRGDLGDFGAPEVAVDLPDAPEVARALGAPPIPSGPLDHGAVVPLGFLVQAGWRGPTAILALPMAEGAEEAAGRMLAELPGRTAVVASGDMSHRLQPGAPAGHHPDAHRFDRAFVEALRRDDWGTAVGGPPFRDLAAEDVVASCRVAMKAAGRPGGTEVIAYEGPFGVGYAEAIFREDEPPLWVLARRAIREALAGRRLRPAPAGPPAGVFVSLHRDGELRGCIGHMAPTTGSLTEEVAAVAPLAALQDPRFPPLDPAELDDLDVEVDVLEPPEPASGPEDLDPRVWGVVVSHGGRHGVLLPDLPGVDTVQQQLDIVRRKAGIGRDEPVHLERFRVRKEGFP